MAWKMYRVTFRLLAPLHVGWFKQGNVQRTRPYVTGKTLWGALTARLTRQRGSTDYQHIGKQVNDCLAFSYFYPSTESDRVPLWPWDNPDEFAWCYLNTYASTALNYTQNRAEEGSLHETEYIAPYTREGGPVYLVGYIFEREGCSLAWKEALPRLQLGGERTYGWGRVEQQEVQEGDHLFGQYTVGPNDNRPHIHLDDGSRLLAHALAADFQDGDTPRRALAGIAGPVEPLVGRETVTGDRFGKQVSQARLCYAPGSQVTASKFACRIGPYGIWEAGDGR